jgi:tRNA A-37 threonylcarbamoyl transferase component Bud32
VTNGESDWVEASVGPTRWQVRRDCREQLIGPAGLRLDEWLAAGQAHIIKHGPHRTVYRVLLPGLDFHLKHYRLMDLRARVRQMIRPAKARMEGVRARAVAERGIPTVTPIAYGRRAGETFLITRTLDGVQPLNAFLEQVLPGLPPGRQARLRQTLARELGVLIAGMHRSGIIHRDLHPANLLVRVGAGDGLRLFVIDLHGVRLGAPLWWPARRDNLVIFNRWFVLRAARTDRLRFWRAYVKYTEPPAVNGQRAPQRALERERARELERCTRRSNHEFWRRRDRRCLVSNRYYRRVASSTAAGLAVRDLDLATLSTLLAKPDEPFNRPGARLLKDSRSATVAEFTVPDGAGTRAVIYKRFRVTAWSDPWTALVRRSPALRSWVAGHGLRERCLPTARPLLVLHRRRAGLAFEGYLLAEKIEGARELQAWLARLDGMPTDRRQRLVRERIEQVARLVRQLHWSHLAHRDLKSANILVEDDLRGEIGPAWLIDLVGVTNHRRVPRSRRVQNVARLHASFRHGALTRADKLRFLRTYLQWGLFGQGGWKTWWREIERATEAKIARNTRSGRPLI